MKASLRIGMGFGRIFIYCNLNKLMLDILRWMVLYSLIIVQLLPIDMMTMMMKAIIGGVTQVALMLRRNMSVVYMEVSYT